jgi:spermidine synthase
MLSTDFPSESKLAWVFTFFSLSGFCSILYELVWLRLAMAKFGVTTALVSIVLSVFMAGLGTGSWIAGALVRRYGNRIKFPPLRLYALSELIIGISALAVPLQLASGNRMLERIAGHVPLSSASYYVVSGAWLALTLVPWCACMGATIPLAMFAIRNAGRADSQRSFSFLYLANVLGAVAGAIIPLWLVELYGFHGTLRIGAVVNTLIAVSAFALTLDRAKRGVAAQKSTAPRSMSQPENGKGTLVLLFTTGVVTMGMEVIWIRLFTPYVGPVVYSFATILAVYLLATFVGSQVYRLWMRRHTRESGLLWVSLAFLGLLPLLTADTRLALGNVRILLGVAPFAGVVGFLTPMLVDRWSGGEPDRAGRAYAVNVVGCIVGPLLAGFVLLPWFGERVSMLLLVLPWFAMVLPLGKRAQRGILQTVATAGLLAAPLAVFLFTTDYETQFPDAVVLRDSTATVTAFGEDMDKQLLVNGIGMTSLTPITKMMAHLPLASLAEPPRNVLIICFGMGTTFRSAISWDVPVTAVELAPSVPKLFWYYHADADEVLASPFAHVVIDDGRRYLERSPQQYDAIIIDPPPPVKSAGSSLLYSRDFYAVVRQRLRPHGILQQWLPEADSAVHSSVTRALTESFPYVRVYGSFFGEGNHYLASMSPIPSRNAEELLARMPAGAVVDLMEWGPGKTPVAQFNQILSRPVSVSELIEMAPKVPALQDDRPINEYYQLRKLFPDKAGLGTPAR